MSAGPPHHARWGTEEGAAAEVATWGGAGGRNGRRAGGHGCGRPEHTSRHGERFRGRSAPGLVCAPDQAPNAFRGTVLEFVLDVEVPLWTAIAVMWDECNWREVVAERCHLLWRMAQQRTAEEREGRPLTPG